MQNTDACNAYGHQDNCVFVGSISLANFVQYSHKYTWAEKLIIKISPQLHENIIRKSSSVAYIRLQFYEYTMRHIVCDYMQYKYTKLLNNKYDVQRQTWTTLELKLSYIACKSFPFAPIFLVPLLCLARHISILLGPLLSADPGRLFKMKDTHKKLVYLGFRRALWNAADFHVSTQSNFLKRNALRLFLGEVLSMDKWI